METRKKPLSAWHYALGLFIMLALIALAGNPLGAADASTVTLRAETWNGGMVHVWHDLDESSERYTALPDITGYVLWHQAK